MSDATDKGTRKKEIGLSSLGLDALNDTDEITRLMEKINALGLKCELTCRNVEACEWSVYVCEWERCVWN